MLKGIAENRFSKNYSSLKVTPLLQQCTPMWGGLSKNGQQLDITTKTWQKKL